MTQLDLLARLSDPETSHEAGARTDRSEGKRKVLAFLRSHPGAWSDHEIASLVGMDKGSAAKRRLDLERDGLVVFSGEFGVSPTGCRVRKWRAA